MIITVEITKKDWAAQPVVPPSDLLQYDRVFKVKNKFISTNIFQVKVVEKLQERPIPAKK